MAKLSAATQDKIRALKDRYPQRRSAVIPALKFAQDEVGYLPEETLNEVAEILEVPANMTAEVMSFYTMYEREPVGKYKLEVCRNLGCALTGNLKLVEYLEQKLGIRVGETTEDGKFTLRTAECLGACGWSPMMQVGDTYYEHLTREKVDAIIEALREDKTPPGGPYTQEDIA